MHITYLAWVLRASVTENDALKDVRSLPMTVLISLGQLATTVSVNTGDSCM